MRTFGAILIGIGFLMTISSSLNAQDAPDLGYLVGTFLPGLLFLVFGLSLCREKPPKTAASSAKNAEQLADNGKELRLYQFNRRASLGVVGGIVLMLMGSGFPRHDRSLMLVGVAILLIGWALMIWGCVNYTRLKGYSGWLGLFGYLLLPGLLILACYPNRRRRMHQDHRPEQITASEALWAKDQISGYRYLLTLVPLGILSISLSGLVLLFRSNIDPVEWKEVARPDLGFHAIMPGNPRVERNTQETPTGIVEVHKFTVEPRSKRVFFMIVSIRFPRDESPEPGKAERLLDIGRQDFLSASRGQLQNEQQIVFGGHPGLELEMLSPDGAIVRARIYATEEQIYQLHTYDATILLATKEVEKFFNSFNLSFGPTAARDHSGK